MNLSVIGLGKLGSPMAACFAAKGFRVIGVDVVEQAVARLNAGQAPVVETGLQALLDRTEGRLSATTDLRQAVLDTDVSFVIVPTPSLPSGEFSLEFVLQAAEEIGRAIGEKASRHVVVLTSTVMPGATQGQLQPVLERASGKQCPRDFGLCYSPEFIALGSVIRDYLRPDFVLIGESDAESGERLSQVYHRVCENNPPIRRMSFVNAELTKLAVNTFVTTKISYANLLAEICERLLGGNVDEVTQALGLDQRIGNKYLKGATAFGGPCFPRDNRAMIRLAESLDVAASLPSATDAINSRQVPRLRELTLAALPPGGTAGVLGLAYKPDTNFVEKAPGLQLAQELLDAGVSVCGYDPLAGANAAAVLEGGFRRLASAAEVARAADVVVVTQPCGEFKQLTVADVARTSRPLTVIDCWRVLSADVRAACRYLGLGTEAVGELATAFRQPRLRAA